MIYNKLTPSQMTNEELLSICGEIQTAKNWNQINCSVKHSDGYTYSIPVIDHKFYQDEFETRTGGIGKQQVEKPIYKPEPKELIKSNCLIQSIKRKLENKKGKIGVGFKQNGRVYFFYDSPDGKRYRFGRKLRRYSNKNMIWFEGFVYCEGENGRKKETGCRTFVLF